ncbi:importin-4-like [Bactrocera oleae]|uniref:importin-4-like n=1 Tax=Bactrocera oleae TaxID=104688 RepID=UPI00387E6028
MQQIIQIITNFLSSANGVIKKATADLQEAYKRSETVPALCEIAVSTMKPQVRQYSVALLKKHFAKLRQWNKVQVEQQQIIKQGMLYALMQEQQKSGRKAIAQFVGVLVRREAKEFDSWMTEVLKFTYSYCSSTDPKQSELGSSSFPILADAASDQFLQHMESVSYWNGMFTAAVVTTEATGNMATPVIFNILINMTSLVPFTLGHRTAEQKLQKSIPLIGNPFKHLLGRLRSTNSDGIQLADLNAKLLNNHIKMLSKLFLEAASNALFDSAMRIKVAAYVGWVVRLKKKLIFKRKLIEPII